MSEEQKIIDLENEISFLKDRLYEEQEQNEYLRDKVDNQQKEIDFYKKEELGYITGYEDGKRHKQTAVAIKNENAQQELFQKEIARLKEIIEKQQKEIEEYKRYFKLAISDLQSEGYMQMPYENIKKYYSKRKDIV